MQIYQLKKKNLPADVLVLKEIARRVLSARQYGYFLKHWLVVRKFKSEWDYRGLYYYSDWKHIGLGAKSIHLDGRFPLLDKQQIGTWTHELAHMVFAHTKNHRNRSKNGGRRRHHTKVYRNIEKRLDSNFETKVKQNLPEIVSLCHGKQSQRTSRLTERTEAIARTRSETKLSSHKLAKTQEAIKRWEGKLKRCETHLKKLRRREKLYTRLIQKKEGSKAALLIKPLD